MVHGAFLRGAIFFRIRGDTLRGFQPCKRAKSPVRWLDLLKACFLQPAEYLVGFMCGLIAGGNAVERIKNRPLAVWKLHKGKEYPNGLSDKRNRYGDRPERIVSHICVR